MPTPVSSTPNPIPSSSGLAPTAKFSSFAGKIWKLLTTMLHTFFTISIPLFFSKLTTWEKPNTTDLKDKNIQPKPESAPTVTAVADKALGKTSTPSKDEKPSAAVSTGPDIATDPDIAVEELDKRHAPKRRRAKRQHSGDASALSHNASAALSNNVGDDLGKLKKESPDAAKTDATKQEAAKKDADKSNNSQNASASSSTDNVKADKRNSSDAAKKEQSESKPVKHEISVQPSDGNCQFWCFLRGLERKHPNIAKTALNLVKTTYPEHKAAQVLTIVHLRKIAADFCSNHTQKPSTRYAELPGYLETDRNEFNDKQCSLLGLKKKFYSAVGKVNKDLQTLDHKFNAKTRYDEQMAAYKTRLESKKIDQAEYDNLIKTAETTKTALLKDGELSKDDYDRQKTPLIKQKADLEKAYAEDTSRELKKNGGLLTNDAYINRSKNDKFWCGNAHVYALSAVLNIPVLVYEESLPGVAVTFNANNVDDTVAPLKLYRVNQNHFNLITN